MTWGERLNGKGPGQVYLYWAIEVGNDLLSRLAVSSAAETLLLSSGWDQVSPWTYGHRQAYQPICIV